MHPSQLRDWVKKFAEDASQAFPGNGQIACDRAASAAEAMKSLAQRCAPALLRATGPTAPGGYGKTCWRKGYRAVCIGLSG